MSALNKKLLRISGAITVLILCLFCLLNGSVYAANVNTVRVEVVEFDACPNIPGIQPEIPDGMVQDSNGNCYTPSAPPQPEVVDLCLNIPGIQVEIPSGHFRTAEGNCYPQPEPPEPPVSVCPDLPGLHLFVPDEHFFDPETGECIHIDFLEVPDTNEDVCWNIPGIQTETPHGMFNDDGYCFTPSEEYEHHHHDEHRLHNVPEFLQDITQFFVNLVPESVQEFFRNLPDEIVDSTPAFTLLWSLLLVIFPVFQVIREHLYKRRLTALYQHEKNIAEEKDNFITLSSHYLRTPIATMRDSATLMLSAGIISLDKNESINYTLKTLGIQVSNGIEGVKDKPVLQNLAVDSVEKPKPAWRSSWFWIPIAISIVMTILLNFFIGIVGEKDIGASNLFLQLVVVAIFIIVLYLVIRNYFMEKTLRQEKKQLIAREQAIDSARNEFIREQTGNIGEALNALYLPNASTITPSPVPYKTYTNGLSALSGVYGKFLLLTQIETGGASRNISSFSIKSTVDRAVASRMDSITAKNINIENNISDVHITQNASLFAFVIGALMDNAVKFAEQNGKVVISSIVSDKKISIRFSDNGRGIASDKLAQLFKPFSRAESAVQFSYEGLGLSLFLSRLILNYMGGAISATSKLGQGTEITITVPTDSN